MAITNIYKGNIVRDDIVKIYKGNELIYEAGPALTITNKLEGSTLNPNYEFAEHGGTTLHTYVFENGPVSEITVNGITSTSTIMDYLGNQDGIDVLPVDFTLDGEIILNYSGGPPLELLTYSKTFDISFKNSTNSIVHDTFTINGQTDICIAAGTLIRTPDGHKVIENFQEGDAILAYDTESKSTIETTVDEFTIINATSSVINIGLSNGSTLRITSSHALLTYDGWKCVTPTENSYAKLELQIGDNLMTENGSLVSVVSIEADTDLQPTYHIVLTEGDTLLATDNENNVSIAIEHFRKYEHEGNEPIMMMMMKSPGGGPGGYGWW